MVKTYDTNLLESGIVLKLERRAYLDDGDPFLTAYPDYPQSELEVRLKIAMGSEKEFFNKLVEMSKAWDDLAGEVLRLRSAIEILKVKPKEHTGNKWNLTSGYSQLWHRSNAVFNMSVRYRENTTYNRTTKETEVTSYTVDWYVYAVSPVHGKSHKLAGQQHKTFTDKAALRKYIEGRVKAYDKYFKEENPPVPAEAAWAFKLHGILLPGYHLEGEAK